MQGDIRLGDFLIQPQLNQISKGDTSHSIEPKVMDVLVYLAEHAGEVMPKERIIQAVWPDTFVTDEVLTNAISDLRKAFGDDAKNPAIIQTIARRGYRLIPDVSRLEGISETSPQEVESEEAVTASVQPTARSPWRSRRLIVAATALLPIVLVLLWYPFTPPGEPIDSIAVLPFVNTSADPDSEYLSSGIPGSISSTLSQLPSLRVIPTSELGRYRGREVSAKVVGDELKVRGVLTGTLAQVADTLSIRVELVDAVENRLLWGRRYKRELADILELEEQITKEITEALRLRLSEEEENRLTKRYTENTKAYEYYLRGRFHLDEVRPEQAIEYFRQAIEADPNYALAWVDLANSHQRLGFFRTSLEHYRKARDLAEKALRIDSSLAEAHLLIAEILAFYDRKWLAAEEELAQATELNPMVTSYRLPYLLLWLDRRDEVAAATERYLERGDPLSAGYHAVSAHRYYYLRDFDRASEAARKAQELGYKMGYLVEWCYQAKGMEDEAFRVFLSGREEKLSEKEKEESRQAFKGAGMKGVRRLQLDRGEGGNKPYDLAGLYALAGEADLAFEWLEKAYELPLFIPFFTDARFDSLRDDLRYQQFLRKLNLPEEAIARHLAG